MKHLAGVLVMALLLGAPLSGDTFHALLRFDTDGDGRLSEDELIAYLTEKKDPSPKDRAEDILTAFRCSDCQSISIKKAAQVFDSTRTPIPPKDTSGPCNYFKVKRTVADSPNPRAPESEFPAIFSYLHDKHATDRDQLNILGAVQPLDCAWNTGDPTLLNVTYGAGLGIDFDMDGSKQANQNKIEGSAPLFLRWVSVKPDRPVSGLGVSLTPKFSTDRALDREVFDVTTSFSFRSRALLRAGLMTNFGGTASFWWAPTLGYEFGDVRDPAGNADLEKLRGSYARFAPRIDAILWPRSLSDRIAIKANLTERYNVAGRHRSYLEGTITYDLTATGNVAFTSVYRHGSKPPAFSLRDQWLVGIGIQR